MRPALAALAEQQATIDRLNKKAERQRDEYRDAADKLRSLVARQQDEIAALTRGIHSIARAAGIEDHVRMAMRRQADVQNPAQPVPEPPAEPATETSAEAETPEAFANPLAPGMVPGSTNDVAADATSTVYTPGLDIPGPAVKELVDVTRPVDGTQNPRPLDEVRTLTDIRVGDPMNPQPAYPLRGDFANAQRLGSAQKGSPGQDGSSGNRTMAAIRLARLRMQAGTSDATSDIELAGMIEKDASLTTESIEAEIATLEGVSKAAARKTSAPRQLVPQRAAGVARTVPSMQQVASVSGNATADDALVRDADLFD